MIDINVPNNQSISISAPQVSSLTASTSSGNVGANTNADAQLAYSWAVGVGLIQGIDYSAKYYANKAQQDVDEIVDEMTEGSNIELIKDGRAITINATTYIHEQAEASDTWTINHNLGKYPSVTVVDSADSVFEPAVEYIDENTCVAEMLGATTGKAYLN